ncbi:MAG: 4-(cytidine 5'-diphospho)-2-C-methyl-D-erythritol kinase [Hyphomicrobiales bacterium]
MITERARAKINLSLHVTGKRADGYHLLDSVVGFTAFGDELTFKHADEFSLKIDGPFGAGLETDADNLVLRAARALAQLKPDIFTGAEMSLRKNLPVASGIGGGSADAAAALRGLIRLFGTEIDDDALSAVALTLGADVPVCLASRTCRMRGIGERIDFLNTLPECPMVLVNPGVEVSTPAIFRALDGKFGNPLDIADESFSDVADFADWLATQRNDLQMPAISIEPVIADVVSALERDENCLLARMSGSGATCFGIYDTHTEAEAAADALKAVHPNWWISATYSLSAADG